MNASNKLNLHHLLIASFQLTKPNADSVSKNVKFAGDEYEII